MKRSTIWAGAGALVLALTPALAASAEAPPGESLPFSYSIEVEGTCDDSVMQAGRPFMQGGTADFKIEGGALSIWGESDGTVATPMVDVQFNPDTGCSMVPKTHKWSGPTGLSKNHLNQETRVNLSFSWLHAALRAHPDAKCDGLDISFSKVGDLPEGTYTLTAQEYDSETVTPSGDAQTFTGAAVWGETVSIEIPAAEDYLLWVYRADVSQAPNGLSIVGEIQLDCRPSEEPEPTEPPEETVPPVTEEPETEEPGSTPPETPEPEVPGIEVPEVGEPGLVVPEVPEAPKAPSEKSAPTPQGGETGIGKPVAVVMEPRTAG